MKQLPLFGDEQEIPTVISTPDMAEADNSPLPLLTADKWGFDLSYINRDGNPQNYLYRIQDWIVGLTGMSMLTAQQTWSKMDMTARFEIKWLPIEVKKGQTVEMAFTIDKGLYYIAQQLRALKSRPQVKEIREYLAEAGAFTDLARMNPAQVGAMLTERAKGIEARNDATQAFQSTHVNGQPQYWALTEAENEILLGATKAELTKQLKLNNQQAKRFRDQFGELTLQAFRMAETASAIKMRELGRKLTDNEQLEIVRHCASMVAPAFHKLTEYLQVDNVRNQPLLGASR